MEQLEREMLQAKTLEVGEYHSLSDVSAKLVEPSPEAFARSPESGATRADLDEAAAVLTEVPASLPVFSKIKKVFEERRRQYHTAQKIDWAFAELLAFGTLLREGHSVRMSGQDVERGTFSQRHAVIMREDTEERHIPLAGLVREGESFKIFNSLLSEFAVLGFEMGYSMERPQGLTVWEAQFGDFGNGAQIIIDNFLSCSRSKWGRHAGLVALLPHGYEGQGAEHSSARLERWLQLCAGLNMQVVYPSTPSSYFHALRRQVRWPWRVPLIVMTPKSLLRNPACVSPREAFLSGAFQEVIDDATVDPSRVRRVILASGKIVYDLEEERGKRGLETVAIVRLEQFYPFPESALAKVLARYPSARLIHAQEEPANMGSQMFLRPRLGSDWRFVSRAESDAPATGVHHIHKQEQAELMRAAFED
jgi:2-oxoglutarate dehydrogenase E1 component